MKLDLNDLASISVGLASPDDIRSWSHGEVTACETINYRNQKPVDNGLYCERIFGPTKDFECSCGNLKRQSKQHTVCEKCHVEVTTKAVRRERMGHIELQCPCTHIWYFKSTPNRVAFLLDVQPKQLEEVAYYASHICITPGTCKDLRKCEILDERAYRAKFKIICEHLKEELTDPQLLSKCDELLEHVNSDQPIQFKEFANFINKTTGAEFGIGAEAIKKLLDDLDIEKEFNKCKEQLLKSSNTTQKNDKLIKRLEVLKSFYESKQKPSWMILEVLPVIPPDLRPLLQLDGGRFATSDLNELYRTVIARNIRLKKFIDAASPAPILTNEKRMLQDAVDTLIDNGKRGKAVTAKSSNRPLKSLSASLKGKQGRFRQNLLGKRVDFSGRSVIAVGPDLRMDQCGIPREMAIQLFRPFIANVLINSHSSEHRKINSKIAGQMIDDHDPLVNKIIEDIISDHCVLLNRAPTLHRLGIQAFHPVLVEGRAIRLHPLVCTGFNADFDGDQMAVHLPLSKSAQKEANELMIANHNILGPKDGKPICIPNQDIVLGNYYLTIEQNDDDFDYAIKKNKKINDIEKVEQMENFKKLQGKYFNSITDVLLAYENGKIHLHNRILIRGQNLEKEGLTDEQKKAYIITTVGKVIFNRHLPKDFPFINDARYCSKKDTSNLARNLDEYFINIGDSKDFEGSKIKTVSSDKLNEYIRSLRKCEPLGKSSLGPLVTEIFRRYKKRTSKILDDIKDLGFKYATVAGFTVSIDDISPVKQKGDIIVECEKEVEEIRQRYDLGLYSEEQRYKLTLNTWEKGKKKIENHLRDRLNTEIYNPVFMMANSGARGSIGNFVSLLGMRGNMVNPKGEVIEIPIQSNFREGATVNEFFLASHGARKGGTDTALKTADSGYLTRRLIDVSHNVIIREDDCHCDHGIFITSLNDDDNNVQISLKERIVGRTSMRDILDNNGELICHANDMIDDDMADRIEKAGIKTVEIRSLLTCESKNGVCKKCYGLNLATGEDCEIGDAVGTMAAQSIGEPGTQLTLKNFHSGGTTGNDITQGLPRVQELLEVRSPRGKSLISKISGVVTNITEEKNKSSGAISYKVEITNKQCGDVIVHESNYNSTLIVKKGDKIVAGQCLTRGAIDPKELIEYTDVLTTQKYVIDEVLRVYASQNIGISDKHIECIVRQMTRKGITIDGGDTQLLPGIRVDIQDFTQTNKEILDEGKNPARIKPIILGITKAALDTHSFLSSASFQETQKVLTDAAVKHKVDYLKGLKENVMVGKLIPAGTGLIRKEGYGYGEDFESSMTVETEFVNDELENSQVVEDPNANVLEEF